MEAKRLFLLSCISSRFISHYTDESWGSSILIMEKDGKAFGRIYWYSDDSTTIYLNWLSVNVESRRQRLGTDLQEIRENIGRKLGAECSCLSVEKDSWMHEWYKRRGYVDLNDDEDNENFTWMKKSLISS